MVSNYYNRNWCFINRFIVSFTQKNTETNKTLTSGFLVMRSQDTSAKDVVSHDCACFQFLINSAVKGQDSHDDLRCSKDFA